MIMIKNESQHIEFKSKFNEDVIETLVAFANTKGGKVLVGVDDTGKAVKNFTAGKESLQNWINEIKTKTQPSIIPDAEIVAYTDSEIVEFTVQEFPIKPVACRGKYFKRVKNSNHQLSLNEILNMHIKTFNSSWDYYPDPNHSVLDISEDKALDLIALYNKNRTIPIEKDVFEFLTKMELIRDGNLTNAGFLLLMKNDSIVSDIELGHFQNEITIKDGITISTDLITEVEEVMAFVRKHISKEFIITANPARIERWDYPLDAIREIVLNMVVHRDYTHHGNSSVKIFPGRIEFFNPGHLPDGITIDDLLKGDYVSDCRNKQIARIFKEIEWIERYGTGIRRIKDYFKEYGSLEPVFENFQHGFRVTIHALNNDISEKGTEKGTEKLNKNQILIIEAIRSNPHLTSSELSEKIGIRADKVRINIQKLKSLGLLERIGPDKGGYWKILSKEEGKG
jgi:ATP-dependent DNA helicase RecG